MTDTSDDGALATRWRVLQADSGDVIDGDQSDFATREQAEEHRRTFHREDTRYEVREVPAR